jgi:DNA polymerase-3 subunit beta
MEITLAKDLFLEALGKVQGIVERRTVTPALSHVYLKADDSGTVTMEATDMDLSLRTSLPGSVHVAGEAVVLARKVLEVIKEMDGPEISVKVPDPRWMTITAGKSTFKLVCLPAADFPPLPVAETGATVTLGISVIQEIIRKTAFAASQEESRYAINGVLLEIIPVGPGATVTAVGTDGHRLALYHPKVEGVTVDAPIRCLIPRRTLMEVRRLFPSDGMEVKIGIGDKGISFDGGGTLLLSRIIQGQFPDYQGVVKVESANRAVVDREAFIHAIRRVSVMGDEKIRQVRLDFSDGVVKITSSHPDMGEAVEEMSIDYGGQDISLAFNAIYVTEGLKAIDEPQATVALVGDFKPCLVKGEGNDAFSYVVMPMRV